MKNYKYTIIILLTAVNIFSQQNNTVGFHPETGYWSVSDKPSYTINTDNSQLFTWQMVQTPAPNGSQLLSIFFIDSLKGWASHTSNGAMRTTNSGFNWTLISFNDTNFTTLYNSVFFIDQNTGWCVGGALQIRKTTDGGVTWFKQYGAPQAGIAHSVQFLDANTGFIAGSKNYPYVPFVEKTTNGGTNWTELSPSFANAHELNKEQFFNASTGWIAGYNVLLKTTDGGASFTNYFANIPPTGNGANALLTIYFVNQTTGWLGGSNLDKQNIYITTNGGLNWTFQPNPVSQNNSYVQINDMFFFSQDSGWAVHGTPFSGAIMSTTNGGADWLVEEGSSHWFQCIDVYHHSKAWVGADNSQLWYSILSQPTGIVSNNTIPEHFSLSQNYPTPFNPSTKINFSVPLLSQGGVSRRDGVVSLKIYNSLGQEISTLVNESLNPGSYEVSWDAYNEPSGIYFYKLTVNSNQFNLYADTKKMILMK